MKRNQTIVIKVGTSSVTHEDGTINNDVIKEISDATTILKNHGHKVILVSSGAIGAGLSQLGYKEKPTELSLKQAIAALGQTQLIQTYRQYYSLNNQHCAQVLITNDVVAHPVKRENVKRTIKTLLELDIIPIVNENDTVSTVEIESAVFSDNDTLSSIVSILIDADMLIVFSDVDGLYKMKDGKLTNEIFTRVTNLSSVKEHISQKSSTLGRGGMTSKIKAINNATVAGIDVVLANINTINQLSEIINYQTSGTFFKGGVKSDDKYDRKTS